MLTQELLNQNKELRQMLSRAQELAAKLQTGLNGNESHALSAQYSVIRAFLNQALMQEEVVKDMLTTRGQTVPSS